MLASPAIRGARCAVVGSLSAVLIVLTTWPAMAEPVTRAGADSTDPFSYIHADRMNLPAGAYRAAYAHRIPSFSRQTKLPCSACHYGFPQLTPFGRLFKLNGYTLTALPTIVGGDSARRTLELGPNSAGVGDGHHLADAPQDGTPRYTERRHGISRAVEPVSRWTGHAESRCIHALTYAADAGSVATTTRSFDSPTAARWAGSS